MFVFGYIEHVPNFDSFSRLLPALLSTSEHQHYTNVSKQSSVIIICEMNDNHRAYDCYNSQYIRDSKVLGVCRSRRLSTKQLYYEK